MPNNQTLFAIPNLKAQKVETLKPWEFKPKIPGEALETKQTFVEWGTAPSTQHCYFSPMEGDDPFRRVNSSNPVISLCGLVADFDAPFSDSDIERLVSECPTDFQPNFFSRTYSGHGRITYIFPEKLLIPNLELLVNFLKLAAKKLRLRDLARGFELESFIDPYHYYECGQGWVVLSNDHIPMNFLHHWLYEAGNKVKSWADQDLEAIPIDVLAAEVEKRYPGRWEGDFAFGAQGVRFWDPEADNPRACVVRTGGMQCFTGPSAFVSWRKLFGARFVVEYQANVYGEIGKKSVYDGRNFWLQHSSDEKWRLETIEAYKLFLKATYNLSPKKPAPCSQLEQALFHVQSNNRVDRAGPFVHYPSGLIRIGKENVLNTCNVQAMSPQEEPVKEWGDGFPWLAKFIGTVFDEPEEQQRDQFLAWLQWAYANAVKQQPQLGQALFIAGPVECGKTFLSNMIVGGILGGYSDASEYLLGSSEFTSDVVSQPVMAVDDSTPATDHRAHTRYSAMIKKVSANQHIRFRRMRTDASQVLWMGRIIVTLNLDSESMDLLPGLEMSNLDKVCLFKCKQSAAKFSQLNEDRLKVLSRELPAFCRWLLDWETPKEVLSSSRYAVRSFHHPDLYEAAIERNPGFTFLELLEDFLGVYRTQFAEQDCWEGTVAKLISDLAACEEFKVAATEFSSVTIGRILGNLMAKGYNVTKRRSRNQRVWQIPFDLEITPVERKKNFRKS